MHRELTTKEESLIEREMNFPYVNRDMFNKSKLVSCISFDYSKLNAGATLKNSSNCHRFTS